MDLYATYTEEQINDAAEKKLQIVNDYLTNLNGHLQNIKKRILIDDNTLLSIVSSINAGFNVILYGPPGTAKSTISEFLPVEFYGAKCNVHTADSEWNVRKVIGGITVTYVKNSSGEYKEKIGPKDGYIVEDVMECYETRLQTTGFDTTFTVIDEFNRTNMDECLGPMFTAMGSDNKILRLDYNKGFNDSFLQIALPSGYRMICNMNKYDRTFTNELSEALSRRFKWIYVGAPSNENYSNEEAIVDENVFGSTSSIKPESPVNLVDVPDCTDSNFFTAMIKKKLFDVINDLRTDIEIGTSYKIDAVKLANHFYTLKLATLALSPFTGIDEDIINNSPDIPSIISILSSTTDQEELNKLLLMLVNDTIDAALVMTVVPSCEAIEDINAVEKNKKRFAEFPRCKDELKRMKPTF